MAKLETFITFQGGAYFEKFWELRFLTSTSFFLGQNNPIERITLKSQTGWWPPLGDLTENFPYASFSFTREREGLPCQQRSNQPTAGRFSRCCDSWVSVTSNTFVLNVIKYGFMLHFHTLPPMLFLPSAPFPDYCH